MHSPLNVKFNTAYHPQVKNWTDKICPGAQLCNCLWSTSFDICGTDITHGTFLHGSGYFKRLSAAGGTTGFEQNAITVCSGNPQLVTNIRVYALQHIYMESNKENLFSKWFLYKSALFCVTEVYLLQTKFNTVVSFIIKLPVKRMWLFLTNLITSRWCKFFHLCVTKN